MELERKSHAQELVEARAKRPLEPLLRELYVDKRHSQEEIARALGVARTTISGWLREFAITRDDRTGIAI